MFAEKFSLLNSQEHTEEIHWSSSSSEFGNTSGDDKTPCAFNRQQPRKRKRKKKVPNTSNLDIKIVPTWNKSSSREQKSPILITKRVCKSPILASSRCSPSKNVIITSPVLNKISLQPTSPILTLKYLSPTVKVRKKLFSKQKTDNKLSSIVRYCDIDTKEGRKRHNISTAVPLQKHLQENQYGAVEQSPDSSVNISGDSESSCRDKLVVKKFFDNNFSSDNTSQHISDTPTPDDSTKSDEIDILSCKTLSVSTNCETKQEAPEATSSKKVRYKKGGLAYRLNMLLKKHNANICLWQHERFLAKNSNFIIPKGEYSVFHIQKSFLKYDNYLLEVCDVNNIKYLILINNLYVTSTIKDDSVIKLYEPFKICDFNQYCKLIINVCKFEIVDIKINN